MPVVTVGDGDRLDVNREIRAVDRWAQPPGPVPASGTNVGWYPCNGTAAQNWTHQSNGELVNPNSGLCLTDPGGNTGARLDIETCTDSAQQQWTLPAGDGGGGGSDCGTANLALNKTATASSTERGLPAANAVDGNTGTRWFSAFSDPQWLEVDLGSSQAICQVTLDWETAYATAFQIQTSTDGSTWTTIYSTTTGTGGTQTLNVAGTAVASACTAPPAPPSGIQPLGVPGLRQLTSA